MGKQFSVGFDGVELVSGLSEDKPVWLYLRADLYEGNDRTTPIWTGDVGSLPPDANRPSYPGLPRGDAGLFAGHLVRGQRVTSDAPWGTPNFSVGPVEVSPGQVLAVTVLMMPRIWFEKRTVPIDEIDKWVARGFGYLLGLWTGAFIGGLFRDLISGGGVQEVNVPCTNTVIEATHYFDYDALNQLRSEGPQRFGPRDNTTALCEPIDSYYWLSANRTPWWSFGPAAPAKEKGSCALEPRALRPHSTYLAGRWGDSAGKQAADCVSVWVEPTDDKHADVHVVEHHPDTERFAEKFRQVRIARGMPEPRFARNVHDGPWCPARSVRPACPECTHFDNLPLSLTMPKSLLMATMLSGAHVGARPAVPLRVDTDEVTRCAQPPSDRSAQSDWRPAIQLREGQYLRELDDDWLEFWTGDAPLTESQEINPLTVHPDLEVELPPSTPISWILECSPQITLATYAELREGEHCISRLRYIRRNEEGFTVTDLLLAAAFKPVK